MKKKERNANGRNVTNIPDLDLDQDLGPDPDPDHGLDLDPEVVHHTLLDIPILQVLNVSGDF